MRARAPLRPARRARRGARAYRSRGGSGLLAARRPLHSGELLGDDRLRVELPEERLRLEQRLAGREPAGCPAALRTGVVAREDRMHGAVLLRLVPEEELAGEDSSVAEQLVDRLRAEREER